MGGTEINGSQSLCVVKKEGYDTHINNHYAVTECDKCLRRRKTKTSREEGSLHLAAEGGRGSRENFLLEMTFELILNWDWGF